MDADIIPLTDFNLLFDIPSYKREDHLFFEDIFSYNKNENAMTRSTQRFFKLFNVTIAEGSPETDSGLFILNKNKLPHDFILFNLVCNLNHNVVYKSVYGDKELYRLSMLLCEKEFNTNGVFPKIIGKHFSKEDILCGNGVVLESNQNDQVAIHMTLHSVDHFDKYNHFWETSFWSHWVPVTIEVDLKVVEPLNQEILPKFRYDYKWMECIPEKIQVIQAELYNYIHAYQKNLKG